mmetsp:Transcript_15381/g.50512  ORF Transcript_15381/g.50512 Transcript_15381/m.50512 type:complete len:454 (+) Transcript_15381:61-1422(+)
MASMESAGEAEPNPPRNKSSSRGTCHKCGRSQAATATGGLRECLKCGVRFHSHDCGDRLRATGLSAEEAASTAMLCPKCTGVCECVGGQSSCHTLAVRQRQRVKRALEKKKSRDAEKQQQDIEGSDEDVPLKRACRILPSESPPQPSPVAASGPHRNHSRSTESSKGVERSSAGSPQSASAEDIAELRRENMMLRQRLADIQRVVGPSCPPTSSTLSELPLQPFGEEFEPLPFDGADAELPWHEFCGVHPYAVSPAPAQGADVAVYLGEDGARSGAVTENLRETLARQRRELWRALVTTSSEAAATDNPRTVASVARSALRALMVLTACLLLPAVRTADALWSTSGLGASVVWKADGTLRFLDGSAAWWPLALALCQVGMLLAFARDGAWFGCAALSVLAVLLGLPEEAFGVAAMLIYALVGVCVAPLLLAAPPRPRVPAALEAHHLRKVERR